MNVTPPQTTQPVHRRRRLATAQHVSKQYLWPLSTLYDNAKAGKVPGAIRRGRRYYFDLDKLDAWLDAGGDIGTGSAQ